MAEGMSGGRKSEYRRQGARACTSGCVARAIIPRWVKLRLLLLIKRRVIQLIFQKTATMPLYRGCGLAGEFAGLISVRASGRCDQVVGGGKQNHAGRIAAYMLCLLFPVHGYAEELPDPTRPPTSITLPAPIAGSPPTGLQSIIISQSRRAAIIDGETVELGGKHGDATLIEVGENGVVLQGAQGRQVLTLFPDVKIMQRNIQAAPNLSVKEVGVARTTKLKARKERK